eukprot:755474-Hanusia_phi.AAC.1
MRTYKGSEASDPGHAAYKSMLHTDNLLNNPITANVSLILHRELQRRKFLRNTPVNDVVASVLKDTGITLDLSDVEREQKQLTSRREQRVPVVRWQLAVMEHANRGRDFQSSSRRGGDGDGEGEEEDDAGGRKEEAKGEVSGKTLMRDKGEEEEERKEGSGAVQEEGESEVKAVLRYGEWIPAAGRTHLSEEDVEKAKRMKQDVNAHVRFQSMFG